MNLTVDIGNSRIKAGIFKGNKLVANCVIESDPLKKLKNFTKGYTAIKNAIICSTVDYPKEINTFLKSNYTLIELSEKTSITFKNAYKTPATLGKDRIASVAGAKYLLPGETILVINAGTCITYDLIDSKGTYQGGNISPGLDMRFKALHTFTSRLPLIEANETFNNLTGRTTKESILSGVQQGMTEEIKGFINTYKEHHKSLKVMLTGGSSAWLKKRLKSKIITEPLLTLTGLNVILEFCLTRKQL